MPDCPNWRCIAVPVEIYQQFCPNCGWENPLYDPDEYDLDKLMGKEAKLASKMDEKPEETWGEGNSEFPKVAPRNRRDEDWEAMNDMDADLYL